MAFGSFALIKLGSFPSPSPLVVSPSLRGLLAPVAEHPVEALAVLEVAAVEHPEDVVDPLDVEAVSAVAVEAVASQEVDVVAAAASADVAAVVDSVEDVDEEDTKCFDLGRLSSHPDMLEKRNRLRCHFGSSLRLPTDTMIIWRRFGVAMGL